MSKTETVIVRMDQELKDRLEAYASVEGVGLSEAVRRLVAQIPVIGKIPSSGTEMYDRRDAMHAKADHDRELVREARKEINKASGVTITQLDGEVMTIREELQRR